MWVTGFRHQLETSGNGYTMRVATHSCSECTFRSANKTNSLYFNHPNLYVRRTLPGRWSITRIVILSPRHFLVTSIEMKCAWATTLQRWDNCLTDAGLPDRLEYIEIMWTRRCYKLKIHDSIQTIYISPTTTIILKVTRKWWGAIDATLYYMYYYYFHTRS